MKWFRLYSDVLHDPKVQHLHPATFKHWINLLCLASKNDPRGELPDMETIAFNLRLKPNEATILVEKLMHFGLVKMTTERRLRVHNWEGRQRSSDDVSTRVRRHREAKVDSSAQLSGDSNVTETAVKRTRGEESRREEKNQKKKTPTESKKKSAEELVEEFVVDEAMRAYARKFGQDADELFVDWLDHFRGNGYRTNQGPVKDATATFRRWIRNATKFAAKGKPAPPATKKSDYSEVNELFGRGAK